jgi:hypothetical protein
MTAYGRLQLYIEATWGAGGDPEAALAALEEMRKESAVPVVPPTRCGNCGHVSLVGNSDERDAIAWAYQAIGARWPNVDDRYTTIRRALNYARMEPGGEKAFASALAALEEMRKESAVPVVPPTRCGNCEHVSLSGNTDERDAINWAYQAIGARWPNVDALDNLSAILAGQQLPHEWPVVPPAEAEEGAPHAD